MSFDLRDVPVTTPETDRRRLRYTVLVFCVLAAVLGVLAVAGAVRIRDFLDQSETRVRGEKVLAAIAWPKEWQTQPTGFRPVVPLLTDSRPHWRQQIATDVPDLSTADSVMHDILTAAGWVRATGCDSGTPTEITCAWESSGYQLQTSVALTERPGGSRCPQDRASCVQVRIMLTPDDPERT